MLAIVADTAAPKAMYSYGTKDCCTPSVFMSNSGDQLNNSLIAYTTEKCTVRFWVVFRSRRLVIRGVSEFDEYWIACSLMS